MHVKIAYCAYIRRNVYNYVYIGTIPCLILDMSEFKDIEEGWNT